MPTDPVNMLGLLLEAALVLSILVDWLLGVTWNRAYFRGGLPLVTMYIPVEAHRSNIPPRPRLDAQFRSRWIGSFMFRQIAPGTYGFREKLLELSLLRMGGFMHGMLWFDAENNRVVMKGFANWGLVFFILFCLALIGLAPGFMELKLAALTVLTLILAVVFLFEAPRYTKVAEFAAGAWARMYAPNAGVPREGYRR